MPGKPKTKPFACSNHSEKIMEAKGFCVFITVSLMWRMLHYHVYSHHRAVASINWTNELQILQEAGNLAWSQRRMVPYFWL